MAVFTHFYFSQTDSACILLLDMQFLSEVYSISYSVIVLNGWNGFEIEIVEAGFETRSTKEHCNLRDFE